MQIIKFDLIIFEDLKTYNLTTILNQLTEFMKEELKKGNKIVIERRYSNSESDVSQIITTVEQLNAFMTNYL